MLNHNALNGVSKQVQAVPAGLSDQPGHACLHLQGIQSQLRPAELTNNGFPIELTTIDAIAYTEPVDFLPIVVEGFELSVLRGASMLFMSPVRRPKMIVIEVHPYALDISGTTSDDLLGRPTKCGYSVTDSKVSSITAISDYGHIIAPKVMT